MIAAILFSLVRYMISGIASDRIVRNNFMAIYTALAIVLAILPVYSIFHGFWGQLEMECSQVSSHS